MKVLIIGKDSIGKDSIGKDSYIGNHIDKWLSSHGYIVYQLDAITDEWKYFDYSSFDVIVHVAGIVHRPDCNDWSFFKRVNADIPISIATMAKDQGVKQYVYSAQWGYIRQVKVYMVAS